MQVSGEVISGWFGWTSVSYDIPIRITQCCTQFESPRVKILCVLYCICIIMWHSHLNDMEIPETRRFILKGFELGTTLSKPNRSIGR